MGRSTVRTAGLCCLVILAAIAFAGCAEDGSQDVDGPEADDPVGEEEPDGGEPADGEDGDAGSEDEQDAGPVELDLQTPEAWPTVGYDERRTNAFASSGGGTGEELYRVQADARTKGAPVIANGLIYVPWEIGQGTSTSGLLGAYDANTGEEVFTFASEEPVNTPLAAADGLVFVQTTNDGLHALDETGETAWHNEGGDGTARLTVADGVLYIVLDGTLYALDADTGDSQWSKELDGPTNDFVGHPIVQEERILVPASTDEGDLYALDAGTRETLWVYDGDTFSTELGQAPSVSDGTVFLGLASESEIHAVDAETGQPDWVAERRVELGWDHPVLPDGNVLNRNRSMLEALDPETGELAWEAQVEAFPDDEMLEGGAEPRAVVVTEQTIYAWATEQGRHTVQAFEAGTGEPQWSAETHLAEHAVAVDDVLFSIGQSSGSPAEIAALDGGYR